MSDSTETVWIGAQASGRTYHTSDSCVNFPKTARRKTLDQIPFYEACSICADGDSQASSPMYRCVECGTQKELPRQQAAAKLIACLECESVTRHERIDQ